MDSLGALAFAIAQWDLKSGAAIKGVYDRFYDESDFVDQLLGLLVEENLQPGVTWLLKHDLEQGRLFSHEQVQRLFLISSSLVHWSARLHTLQMIPLVRLDAIPFDVGLAFVRSAAEDKKTLVRAWGLGGLMILTTLDPQLMEQSRAVIVAALNDGPASVRARIRNVAKNHGVWRFCLA